MCSVLALNICVCGSVTAWFYFQEESLGTSLLVGFTHVGDEFINEAEGEVVKPMNTLRKT